MMQQNKPNVDGLAPSIEYLRQCLRDPNISTEEKDQLQSKLIAYQSLFDNYMQQQQQAVLQARQQALHAMQQASSSAGVTFPSSTVSSSYSPMTAATVALQQQHGHLAQSTSLSQIPAMPSSLSRPLSQTPLTPSKSKMHFATMTGPPFSQSSATSLQQTPMDNIDSSVSYILTKRKVQELVGQIDHSERLEPEVENALLEIADEFIDSVTTFACRLAKHRKSDTLEVKDLQLHLERNWNIRIPGFASDDIRSIRKATTGSSHQNKLQAISIAKTQTNMPTGLPTKKDE